MNDRLKTKLTNNLTEDNINEYFDLIIDIYISWIDSQFANSLQLMKEIVMGIEDGVNKVYNEHKILENISDSTFAPQNQAWNHIVLGFNTI